MVLELGRLEENEVVICELRQRCGLFVVDVALKEIEVMMMMNRNLIEGNVDEVYIEKSNQRT